MSNNTTTVQISNVSAEQVGEMGSSMFTNVDFVVESGDFWSTFKVWAVSDTEESRQEVERFVDWADNFEVA